MNPPKILLIGPRGSGKSTIGPALARRLGCRFVDLDDLVLGRFPEPTVTAVWARHGEEAWRAAEVHVLAETLASDAGVLALGGGTPLIPEAEAMILQARRDGTALVAYLRCSVEELTSRLMTSGGDRPALTGDDPVGEIPQVLARREPVYRAVADVEIDASAPVEAVTDELMRLVRTSPRQGGG